MMLKEGCTARLDQLLLCDMAPSEPDPSAGWHKEQQPLPTAHPSLFYPNPKPPIVSFPLLLSAWHEISLLPPGGIKPYDVCLVTIDVDSRQKRCCLASLPQIAPLLVCL